MQKEIEVFVNICDGILKATSIDTVLWKFWQNKIKILSSQPNRQGLFVGH